jgi:cation transport ATPase
MASAAWWPIGGRKSKKNRQHNGQKRKKNRQHNGQKRKKNRQHNGQKRKKNRQHNDQKRKKNRQHNDQKRKNNSTLKVNVILILLFSIQATAKTMDKFAQEKFEDAKRAIRRRK